MQQTKPTKQDISRWSAISDVYRPRLYPNRISGEALYDYLETHYPLLPIDDTSACQVVSANILENECFASALPEGVSPDPVCCKIAHAGSGETLYQAQEALYGGCDIFVGIDRVTGYYIVEGSSLLWDELYAHRGLNETDLKNDYCVAEYVSCLERFGLLEQVLSD